MMMSDVELFFAEQEAIMNRPSESVEDYLARRQRSRTTASYAFNPETMIAISTDSANALRMLQQHPNAPPAVPPQPDADGQGPNSPPRPQATTVSSPPESARAEEDPPERKRKADDAGTPHDRRKQKKSKSIDELPTPTAASAAMASGAPVGPSEASASAPAKPRQHEARPAELSMPPSAALAAIEDDARARGTGAPAGPAGKSELPTGSSPSCADVQTDGEKRPRGVREPQVDSGSPHGHDRNDDAPADCTNITTPPSTAPDPAPPVSTAAPGKTKAAPRAREPARRVVAGRVSSAAPSRGAGKGKGKKEKEPRYTPSEYARVIQAQLAELQQGGKAGKAVPFLKGKRIYFHGGDLNMAGETTRNRMKLIVKHGGELLPEFDPERTTHIICEPEAEGSLLEALKMKRLTDIPKHIPTVRWSWVVDGQGRHLRPKTKAGIQDEKDKDKDGARPDSGVPEEEEDEYPMDWVSSHAAFKARIDAGHTPWGQNKAARTKSEGSEPQANNGTAKNAGPNGGGGSTGNLLEGQSGSDEFSHISDFTQDNVSAGDGAKISPNAGLPSPPSSPRYPRPDPPHPLDHDASPLSLGTDAAAAGPSTTKFVVGSVDDPLAEFYPLARAERDRELLGEDESDDESIASEEDGDGEASSHGLQDANRKERGKGKGSRFVCDDKNARQRRGACPNRDIIAKLRQLQEIVAMKPSTNDRWRSFSLNKSIAALRTHPTRIKSVEEAAKIKGIGPKTAEKIMEVVHTGDLRRIKFEMTEDIVVLKLLTGIYGVGPKVARIWYNSGVRTLEDVAARKGGIRLSIPQKIGFKYYDDINSRIPRAEVQEIYDLVQAEALKLDPKLFIRVMGSFRRGKADCGDIDVLITRPTNDGKTHRGILRRLLAELHKKGIITEDLNLPNDFEDLELVYRGLCRRDAQSRRRRIDFLTVPWMSRGAALLYYTGDDIFNRSMRMKANKMGYSLNQRGLHAGVIRDPTDRRRKLHDGKLIASESEEEIFRILGVPWQEPHERIRN